MAGAEETFGWYMWKLPGSKLTLGVTAENVNDGEHGWDLKLEIEHSKEGSAHTIQVAVEYSETTNAPESQSAKVTTNDPQFSNGDTILVEFKTNGGGIDNVSTVFQITVGQSPDNAYAARGTTTSWP